MKRRNSFFFDHDYSARNDQKILMLRAKFGMEGYGLYWALLESMAEDTNGYLNREAIAGLSLGYGVADGLVLDLLEYGVKIGLFLRCDHGNYYSERMLDHKKYRTALADFGAKGAEKRWGHREAIAPPIAPPIPIEESRGEEIREKDKEKTKRVAFAPPLFDEVQEYCQSRKNGIDPTTFMDFYQTRGWKVGKDTMKDWKAAVRTWENRRRAEALSKAPNPTGAQPAFPHY